jgi:hypothetical protein
LWHKATVRCPTSRGFLQKIGRSLFARLAVQRYPFEPLLLLEGARRIRDAVGIPVGYIGGALSSASMESLVAEGFAFVQLRRPTIRDPEFVSRLERGEISASDCDQCNRCIASMSLDGVTCVSAGQRPLPPPLLRPLSRCSCVRFSRHFTLGK